MGVETTKGRRSRGVRSRILLTAISWLFLHTVHLFTIPHGRISPSRPGWKDSRGPQVTRWHPGRGGVASRASPQQDSGAEDWLAKSCEEVASFGEEEVLTWAKAVLAAGGLKGPAENTMKGIGRVLKILSENEVTGKALLRLTVEKMMAAPYNIPGGPAEILAERIQLLKEPQVELPRFSATDLLDFEDRFLNSRINNKDERIPSALLRKDPDLLASAIILWHLCRIFDGYSVEEAVFEQWLSVTSAAFNATPDCACLVFLDQAELLVNSTVNILIDRPSEEYTSLKVQEIPALAPLSLQAARRAMAEWGGLQYKKKEFDNIHLFSAGVPRLLEAAFQTWGELASTAQVALNAMSQEFRSSYADAAPYFNQPEVALALVLCSAVRWPAEGHQLVPGTSVRWSDIFRAGAAFPNNKSVLVPRLWWCEDTNIKDAIRSDLKELNIDLEGLLPDSLQLLNSPTRGATERGEKWEELVANSLAARFRLHCIARNLSAEVTWVPFLKIYPTEDPHLRAVLEPFEVCWSDGVEYPSGQGNEATVMSDVGKAIKSNRNFATAHHDLLIPVRCKATGKLEFIAAQCRYGKKKDAGGLKLQDKAKKDDFEDMQNVLLQICSESEGWQSFTNETWARRQEEKKYSLMWEQGGLKTAPVDVSVAPAMVPVAVITAQEIAPEVSSDRYLNLLDQAEVEAFWQEAGVRGGSEDPVFQIDWAAARKDIVDHPSIKKLCDAAAAQGGQRAAAAVRQQATTLANELAALVESRTTHFTSALARFMFQRLYSGLIFEREQLNALANLSMRARAEGRSIVYLPSHKSHIDYLVLQFALWNLGLGAPAIAAGENLNLPFVGRLLRRNGAFYIRRSFSGKDSELYTAVVAAYMEGLLLRGANVKFFSEGGRSRSGKLLQPKIGLLGMVVDPILAGHVEDAYVVPVSIYYDGVMETESYVRELLGNAKRKESLMGVLGQGKHLLAMPRSRYGNIHVRFAPGFSARSFIENYVSLQQAAGHRANFDPQKSATEKGVLLKALAYHVLEEINRVSSVTPTALVGTVLLCTLGRGIGRRALINKVEWLRGEVVRSGGHMSHFYDFPGELTAEVVDSALAVLGNLVQTFTGLVEPVYCVAPGMSFELSYYRNLCVHAFIHQAIVTAVLHRTVQKNPTARQVQRVDLMSDVRFLSRLLKREFVFSGAAVPGDASRHVSQKPVSSDDGHDITTALMRNFESALELLVSEGVLDVHEGSTISLEQYCKAQELGGYDHWNKHFTFLCSLVWPLIESYWLVLASLLYIFRHGLVITGEKRAVVCMQTFAKTLVQMGHVTYDEAASAEPLKKALQTYNELGIVRWARRIGDQGEKLEVLELEPEYRGTGDEKFRELIQLTNEVASYRRCWREQEGPEDYPEYIARMAFGASKQARWLAPACLLAALVMEKLLDVDKMLAEHIPYRMGWKRTEVSNHGNFKPALQRVALGDRKTRSMMITGLQQIAGSRAGDLDECFRFVEFELGGLKFLTKARAFAQQGGKNVDVNHKNFYYQDEVKALSTYFKMLLGKADKNVLVLQRSGKLHQVVESTPESILEKQPMIKEAAARRFGRLVELLKKVQKEVDSADDGPWVLQWQAGQLILGKFELARS
ncbi:unnamed protein product [Effrenium voratum]|uniref:Phospholipid/glycerol acyltransferase domain-containing protein n=1 Tax=Effrenium voratum TaxID=2562239 RepID=A0AA36J5X3_9DINO|nr:unnamed protein product [Effrenium voratum]